MTRELFAEGFVERKSRSAYIPFRFVGDDTPRQALFDTGFNRDLAVPSTLFDYLMEAGLIRSVVEDQEYIAAITVGRGRQGETDILLPGRPDAYPERRLNGLCVVEFNMGKENIMGIGPFLENDAGHFVVNLEAGIKIYRGDEE